MGQLISLLAADAAQAVDKELRCLSCPWPSPSTWPGTRATSTKCSTSSLQRRRPSACSASSSSAVYLLNDLADADKDRLHPKESVERRCLGSVVQGSSRVRCDALHRCGAASAFYLKSATAGPHRLCGHIRSLHNHSAPTGHSRRVRHISGVHCAGRRRAWSFPPTLHLGCISARVSGPCSSALPSGGRRCSR